MMTEEEAKTKWCCNGGGGGFCAASKCMAWRWVDDLYADDYKPKTPTGKGYCGLAGKP